MAGQPRMSYVQRAQMHVPAILGAQGALACQGSGVTA
jgi:hypothetical protein